MSKCMTNPNFCEKRFSSVDGITPMFMHGKKIRKKLPLLFFKDLDHEKLDDIWHIQIKNITVFENHPKCLICVLKTPQN